jgi:hypothetical protein
MTHRLICPDPSTVVAEKSRVEFFYSKAHFSTYLLPKTPIKHFRNYEKKPIYDLKKLINHPKNQNQLE